MKIRNKLTIQFTLLVASILVLFCGMIYYRSMIQIQVDFYELLEERTLTTAYIFLEEDGFPPDLYETVRQRYLRTLHSEVAQLFDLNNNAAFLDLSDEVTYDDELINFIRDNEYHEFRDGDRQAVGIFYRDNQGDFVVIVSAIDVIGKSHLSNLYWTLLTGILLSVIILFIAGRFFATQALKPIPRIVKQVNNISAANLKVRLEEGDEDDEIAELAGTFNNMLDRFEDTFSVQQRFVANASHELRSPLTSIIGEIEVARKKERSPDEYVKVLNSIHQDALTLKDLITGLLNLAEAESEKIHEVLKPVRVDEIAIEAGMQIEKKYPGSKVMVNYLTEIEDGDYFIIPANRPLLLNAFANVIDNAIKFSPKNPVIELFLDASESQIEFSVKDSGIGIPQDEIGNIYDPFFRAKDALSYQGYGIGLSLVKRVLSIMQGEIQINSVHGDGTTVSIFFRK
jgi:two-component system, OmpR family, sensor histidine kinase ArlS